MKKRIDVLIKGGTIYDGSLDMPYSNDIAISRDIISGIGSFQTGGTALVIDWQLRPDLSIPIRSQTLLFLPTPVPKGRSHRE
jgi:hypothetical protein